MDELRNILQNFDTISLEEMSGVKLMNRVDSKFPMGRTTLTNILNKCTNDFYVQEVQNEKIATYRTLYFDTDDALTYTVHHNRRLHRQKIRQRIYVDSQIAFCEIKNKKNTGRTKKKRIQIPLEQWGNLYSFPEMANFINERVWISKEVLSPRLENKFHRITLVNFEKTERITIDFDISFHNHLHNCNAETKDLVIVEVKQDGYRHSKFRDMLCDAHVHKKCLSKYCLGMLLTEPDIKYNRFKNKIRYINKITDNNFKIKALQNYDSK